MITLTIIISSFDILKTSYSQYFVLIDKNYFFIKIIKRLFFVESYKISRKGATG